MKSVTVTLYSSTLEYVFAEGEQKGAKVKKLNFLTCCRFEKQEWKNFKHWNKFKVILKTLGS